MSQDSSFFMEKPLEAVWVGVKLGRMGSQVITEVRQSVLAQLMETKIWWPRVSATQNWGGLNKRMISASISAPPAPALKPDNSIPSYVSLVPFKLLSHCWSLVSQSIGWLFKKKT